MTLTAKPKVVSRIVCGPPGSGKTARLLEAYADCVRGGRWDAALYLVPTVRVADLVRGRMREVGLSGLFDFRVMTFAEAADALLVANHVPVAAISDLQQRCILRQILEQMSEDELGPLAAQRAGPGLVTCLLEDINELKAAGVEPKALLDAFQADNLTDPVALATARVYQHYQDFLRSNSPELFDGPGMLWQASQQLDRARKDRRQARPFEALRLVLADGFSDFTTVELQMLARLAALAGECLVSLTYEPGQADGRPELQAIPKRTWEALHEHLGSIGEVQMECLEASREADTDLAYLRRYMFDRTAGPRGEQEGASWDGSVTVMQAPGPWGEVRMVAREVKRLIGLAGGPERLRPGQIGIIARSLDNYRIALGQVFAEYGLPIFVAGGEPVADRPCVRFVADLLRLIEEDYPRAATVAVLDAAWEKIAGDKRGVAEGSQADYVSRQAGITGGADIWEGNLNELIGRLEAKIQAPQKPADDTEEDEENEDDSRRRSSRRENQRLREAATAVLEAFRHLRHLLGGLNVADTRAELTARLLDALRELGVGERLDVPENVHESAANRRAWQALLDALEAYADADRHLGGSGPRVVEPDVFAAEVREILQDLRVPAQGRGEGKILALDIHGALQMTFDSVFLLGLTEGSFPRRARSDPLLPDSLRARLAQRGLPLRQRISEADEEAYLFQLAVSAARQRLYLCYSDTDAAGQPILRSYYIDEAERLLPVLGSGGPGLRRLRLRDVVPKLWDAGSRREMAERVLWLHYNTGRADDAHLLNTAKRVLSSSGPKNVFAHAFTAALIERTRSGWTRTGQRLRTQPRLGAYDGNLGAVPNLRPWLDRLFGPEKVFSASSLGQYGKCPMAFMFERILRLEELQEPGEELEPADLGILVHSILACFYSGRRDAGKGRVSEENLDEARAELWEAAEKIFAEFEREGRAGDARLWEFAKDRVLQRLGVWLEAEAVAPAKLGVHDLEPRLFERRFGDKADDVLILDTPQAGPVRIRGKLDRIDLVGDDGFFLFDYKTGSTVPSNRDISEGRELQMPLYALAGEKVLLRSEGDCSQRTCKGWAYVRVGWPAEGAKKKAFASTASGNEQTELVEEALAKVGEHVANIRSGRFVWPEACPYENSGRCAYKFICRYEFRKAVRRLRAAEALGETTEDGHDEQ